MPNWTFNTLIVRGSDTDLKAFREKYFDGKDFDFDKIRPQPKTKEECPKEYICDAKKEHIQACEGREWFNWYKWNRDNWGTKWNACETYVYDKVKGELTITFSTAWCAPEALMRKLRDTNPQLKMKYEVEYESDFESEVIF